MTTVQKSMLGLAALFLSVMITLSIVDLANPYNDPFAQDNFPCQEDEYLGYSPTFEADKTGCVRLPVGSGIGNSAFRAVM